MTNTSITLVPIDLVCPVCEAKGRSNRVVTTNWFGGKTTHFYEKASGDVQPLSFQIHICGICGFAGSEADFAEVPSEEKDGDACARLRVFVQEAIVEKFAGIEAAGSDKYDSAAQIAEFQGRLVDAAERYLRASYCASEEGDYEAERYFMRYAAWRYAQALSGYDLIALEERARVTYLIGELWRRIGDNREAHKWFDKVRAEILEPHQAWILQLSNQQKIAPREWLQ